MQHLDEETLQAWLDGARSGLDPSRLARIERHLAACDACSSRADALALSSFRAHGLLALGRDQYAPRVPYEDVAMRAQGTRALERSRKRRIPATWAASIVAAAAVGWMSNELDLFARSAPPSVPSAEVAGAVVTVPNTLLASASASLIGSDGFLVSGVVSDEGGRPVPSAQVYVAGLAVSALTQQDGRYDLRLPADPDSFELTVQRIGFRQQAREILSGEGESVDADFRLREEALALDEIVVTGESEGAAVSGTRARPFMWRPLSSTAAEGYVGSDLWMLLGLDVLSIEVALGDNPNETHVARVRQRLGDGTTLTLVQGRTDGRRTRWPVQSTGAVESTWRGAMLITATAPVSADSLRTLLTRLR
jgi:anti-sigma factor RsiW